MTTLHMIELMPDLTALLRFLYGRGLDDRSDEDLGYGVHAWLRAAFGDLAPKPFRLFAQRGRPVRILGYSAADAAALGRRSHEFADPSVHAVCSPEHMASREMPTLASGRRVAFEVLCCPVARKSRTGVEKDLFLVQADRRDTDKGLDRAQIYCDWIRERLDGVADVVDIRMAGFRLVPQARRTQPVGAGRKRARLTRPHVLITGECVVADEDRFMRDSMGKGIGRHRAFGYGMLLLKPPR
jgi:CRISPR system Cascade subunit CasE